jgi:diaminohydroxyphosphoribosylaminopyrimidine deaminase/5-amino-6-(5-phosphoribosylamino)uracil reductase
VGTGTALADDPELTCRLPGLEDRSPVRIVLDRHLRLPATMRLFGKTGGAPAWVVTLVSSDPARQAKLAASGVKIIAAMTDAAKTDDGGKIDLAALLHQFAEEGLTRLLVEGGGQLGAALLRQDLVDRLVWMRAPMAIGGDGLPAVAALGLDALADAPRFTLVSSETAGGDVIDIYRRRE